MASSTSESGEDKVKATEVIATIEKPVDIYRDTVVRYLGYANEVGEAFRALVPVSVVIGSYVVASTYVCADAYDKGSKAAKDHADADASTRRKKAALAGVDCLVWQALASVMVPGFTINRICWASNIGLKKIGALPTPIRKWTVTAIGLSAIPFIIHPIDNGIHWCLDKTLRPACGIPTVAAAAKETEDH